jgi:sugar lactone lactonase YvrE
MPERTEVSMQHELVAEVVVDCRSLLGEGVTWDAATATLLWVDVDRQLVHRLGAAGPRDDHADGPIGHDHVVAMGADGRFGEVITTLPPDGDGLANDGRVDPHGRLWVGTVDRSGARRAALVRVDVGGGTEVMLGGRALSNGIDWSPDGRRCYHADSMLRRIDELQLDAHGDVTDVREFARFEAMPDGLSVDEEGCVWVALWDGGRVERYMPDGRLDRTVSVPGGGWVTNCAFGGPDGRTLYVTTACVDLDADVHRSQPYAGSLYAVDVDVAGRGYTPIGSSR